MQKTKFTDRVWKLNPTIKIYDLDGTIIDSSPRRAVKPNGEIDLDKWRETNTKEMIEEIIEYCDKKKNKVIINDKEFYDFGSMVLCWDVDD